jgi:phosphoglycolate phosphatase-like HAD superfamily hydrolase
MPFDASRVLGLCFDVDGTLSDTDDLFVRQLKRYLRSERLARRLVMWLEAPGNALLGLADRLGIDDEIARLIDWIARHRRKGWHEFLIIPGVPQMLRNLSSRYPMAIVSTRDEESTRQFLDHFQLTPFFRVVVTALTCEHTKPYPDPIFYAARAMGIKPEECLMIGDTTVDIYAGRAAGAQTVGVLCGFGEEKELRRAGADLILPTTTELERYLL